VTAARLPAEEDRNALLRKAEIADEANASEWLASADLQKQ
jgi:hypothetical protein